MGIKSSKWQSCTSIPVQTSLEHPVLLHAVEPGPHTPHPCGADPPHRGLLAADIRRPSLCWPALSELLPSPPSHEALQRQASLANEPKCTLALFQPLDLVAPQGTCFYLCSMFLLRGRGQAPCTRCAASPALDPQLCSACTSLPASCLGSCSLVGNMQILQFCLYI